MQLLKANPIRTAILIGILSAAVTWASVYVAIHKPVPQRTTDSSILIVTSCPGDDDDLTASYSAAGAYILAFTSSLVALRRPRNVFAR
jgi:hypothetical protein